MINPLIINNYKIYLLKSMKKGQLGQVNVVNDK